MEKKYKVVFNSAVYGGLILSSEAVAWLREYGYTGPLESDELLEWDPIIRENLIPRHHPLLVECVEMLGERASGYLHLFGHEAGKAELQVAQITGRYYYIDDHDGAGEEVIDITKMIDASI